MISETVQVSDMVSEADSFKPIGNNGIEHTNFDGNFGSITASVKKCDEGSTSEAPRGVVNVQDDIKCTKVRIGGEMTMEDIYNNPDDLDDDEDDIDWEPLEKHFEVKRWFCANCTMVNLDDGFHCNLCGEHKKSGIIEYGFFAFPHLQGGLSDAVTEVMDRYKESFSSSGAIEGPTLMGFDERMLLHLEVEKKSHPHPERPDRLRAIAVSLANAGIFPGKCKSLAAREITREELLKAHSLEHIESVEHTAQMFSSYFTPDTYANEHSAQAARLAAGLCADLASEIYHGHAKNGFALIRPPGHHAGVHQAMGFCLHNNAAVAALAAQIAGAKKILIVDWDVHHGNGTQEIFNGNKAVLYISLHRHESGMFYPGTGAAHEVGSGDAEGYCVNVPWSCGRVGDNDYIFAFQHVVLPIACEFRPDFTIVSAGFDAARGDPLGGCDVTPEGYACMTHMLGPLSSGKLLVILEGGYNLRSISSSAAAVIKVLLGERPEIPLEEEPSRSGMKTVLDVLKIQTKFWPCLSKDLSELQLLWESYLQQSRKSETSKRRTLMPDWRRWGRKRIFYYLLAQQRHRRVKAKRTPKGVV